MKKRIYEIAKAIRKTVSEIRRYFVFKFRKVFGSEMYISKGNKKLKSSKDCRFLIWNLPSVFTCPNACPHCKESCYARKAELFYHSVILARVRNLNASEKDDFVEVMAEYIKNQMSKKSYKNAKRVIFRIHESGDFYSREYWLKWVAIAEACKEFKNLRFLAYTKSVHYIASKNEIPSNMTVRGSVWDDTDARTLAKIVKLELPIYTADTAENVNDMVENKSYTLCECKDCGHCKVNCADAENRKTVVVIH